MNHSRRALLTLRTRPTATATATAPEPESRTPATERATPHASADEVGELPPVISWLKAYITPDSEAAQPVNRPGSGCHAAPALLRPPGALAEQDFAALCTKCGDCIGACPHNAIEKAPAQFRGAAGTPRIDPARAPCRLCEDMPCIRACEVGALQGEGEALGQAHIDRYNCLNSHGSSCRSCVEHCPVPGAIDCEGALPRVHPNLCVGCGVCQFVCPAPIPAIAILPNRARATRKHDEEIATTPGHQ